MQWLKRHAPTITASARQSVALLIAANLAYVLDYLYNFVAGRLLSPAEFSIVVALAGVGNVLVVGSRVVQTVMTRYVSRFQAQPDGERPLAAFFRTMWRLAWRWGAVATAVLLLLSPLLARWLQIEQVRIVLPLALTAVLLMVRPVIGGTLQGTQRFAHLGVVQVVQALTRLLLGGLLMWLGWGAFGAMVALPVGSSVALLYGLAVLDKRLWQRDGVKHGLAIGDLFRYSAYTAVGLIGFAILLNMDAILARRFFDAETAGNYSAAVTLGKIVQFIPVTIVTILFPKTARRQAAQQDTSRVLLMSLLLVLLLCGGVVGIYALFTDWVVRLTVGGQYQVDSLVLGLLGVGLLLLSLANVWLYYFLSIERIQYVYLVVVGIAVQATLMALFHAQLWQLPAAIAINGLWLTLAGAWLFWRGRRAS